MPEGPSIAILREEASIFKGKKILEVSGNSKAGIEKLKNRTVTDIRSWGKHLLVCTKGLTMRIHLMMFGSYRINEKKDEATPRVSLRFSTGELNFYTCSVKLFEEDPESIYDWEVDVMSDRWNETKAIESVRASEDSMVCDVLLDQHIFSGSGNIFKNEVLFKTKIHPESVVMDLPPKKLKELVRENRDYAFDFYKWKKAYVLSKHWKAYKQKVCPRCNIPFKLEHLGKGKRRTFFCESCQVMYGEKKPKKTPAKDLKPGPSQAAITPKTAKKKSKTTTKRIKK